MLPQPVPVTGDAPGAPLSRSDQVRQAARAQNTQRAYLGHWTRFHRWAQEQGLDLPGGLEAALDYLVRLAEDGKRMATIRQARAAIIKGAGCPSWMPRLWLRPLEEGLTGRDDLLYRGVVVVSPAITWHTNKQLEVQWVFLVACSGASVAPEKERGFAQSDCDAQVQHYPLIRIMAVDDEYGVSLCDFGEIFLAKPVGPARRGRGDRFAAIRGHMNVQTQFLQSGDHGL